MQLNDFIRLTFWQLSHGYYDHMGEAINLVSNFKVEKVVFNCGEYNYLEVDFVKNPILIKNSNTYDIFSEKVLQKLILEDIENFLDELGNGFI